MRFFLYEIFDELVDFLLLKHNKIDVSFLFFWRKFSFTNYFQKNVHENLSFQVLHFFVNLKNLLLFENIFNI